MLIVKHGVWCCSAGHITHSSRHINCSRVNPIVICGLGVIMCHCRLTNCNRHIICVWERRRGRREGGVNREVALVWGEQGVYGIFVLFSQFCYETAYMFLKSWKRDLQLSKCSQNNSYHPNFYHPSNFI